MLKKIVFLMVSFVMTQAYAQKILVISCTLNPESHRTVALAQYAAEDLKSKGQNVEFIDLRQYKLPINNGHEQSAFDDPQVKELHDRIDKAQAIIIVAPIYNYNVAAAAKNLVELTTHKHKDILSGQAWRNKIVGFIGVSGGAGSMLAFFPFLNGLMMDSKVVIVPTVVMASSSDFNDKSQVSAEIKKRIEELSSNVVKFTNALAK
jgi:FMN reductase